MPAVISQLEKVLQAAPDHLSARLLWDYAVGRDKLIMSLAGSIECIDREASEVLNSVKESALEIEKISGIKKDSLGGAIFRLRRLRAQLHPQTRPLLDSMETFSSTVRTIFENPPRSPVFIDKARNTIIQTGTAVQSEYQKLRSDPAVVAELMNE